MKKLGTTEAWLMFRWCFVDVSLFLGRYPRFLDVSWALSEAAGLCHLCRHVGKASKSLPGTWQSDRKMSSPVWSPYGWSDHKEKDEEDMKLKSLEKSVKTQCQMCQIKEVQPKLHFVLSVSLLFEVPDDGNLEAWAIGITITSNIDSDWDESICGQSPNHPQIIICMYYIILYYILYYIILIYIILIYIILYCIILHYITLHYIILYSIILYYIILYYIIYSIYIYLYYIIYI